MIRSRPALLISAPASGQGKTTVTAAVVRLHRKLGHRVRVFKYGPDFIDPMFLEAASGYPVYPLDLWMVGEAECRRQLYVAAGEADLILVEGMMGLFDGSPASADLAEAFGLPVLAVIDASAMAETFGAVALGLATLRPSLRFAGVLANRVAGAAHTEMLGRHLPAAVPYKGALYHRAEFALPERHLGLVQASELGDLDGRLDALAAALADTGLAVLPEAVQFAECPPTELPRPLDGVRIGVARDLAFSFVYQANLELLRTMGAELVFFSPLRDTALPALDSVYLTGGYPELHLQALAGNTAMKDGLRAHAASGKPMLAECGGMLYLLDELVDQNERMGRMCGVLPGRARMQMRLMGLGLQSARFETGELRGHTFHHSIIETSMSPSLCGERQHGGGGEAIYRQGRVTASYLHWYFPSSPSVVADLFRP